MKRIVTLLTLLFTTMTFLHAGTDYAKEWKGVEQLMEKGSMTSAQAKAADLFEAARQAHNSYYTLYGALMLQQIEDEYTEDAFQKALDRYHAIEAEVDAADRALLLLFEARMYQRYRDRNQWTIRNNLHPQKPTDDIAVWDYALFTDTIHALQMSALADSDVLKKTKSRTYEDFLTEPNTLGQLLRPTLYDIVMQEIIDNTSTDDDDEQAQALFDDPALYGPAEAFCARTLPDGDSIPLVRNLRLLQTLTRFHVQDEAALRRALDEQRLTLVSGNMLYDKIRLREGLEQLADAYTRKGEQAERAYWIYRQASYWHTLEEQDEEYTPQHNCTAFDLCQQALALAPKGSEAAAASHNLIAELTLPTLTVGVPETLLPDEANPALINHSNLTHLWFRIIETDQTDNYYDHDKMKELLKEPVLHHWDTAVDDAHDYLPHVTHIQLPALDPGRYLLLASSTANFSLEGNLQWVSLNVSALAILFENDRAKGERIGLVVHRKTGLPVTDCDVSLWAGQWKNGEYEKHKVADVDLAADGFFAVTDLPKGSLTLKATDGASVCERSVLGFTAWGFSAETRCQLFTDRQSYRPGDEVQFTALVYEEVDANHFRIVPNKAMKVELHNVNHEVVQAIEGVTDAYGCFSGTFTLGESLLPGMLSLKAEATDESFSSTHRINLEAYKQPTFAIRFEEFPDTIALTDTVHVRGAALSYTAVPVQEARVSYRVTRAERPSWRWWYGHGVDKTVARGLLTTRHDGTFALDLPPLYTQENKRLKDRCYRYRISVDITALDGETQHQETAVTIGRPYHAEEENVRPDIMPEEALLWGYQPDKTVELGDTLRLSWGTRRQAVCVVWFLERGYKVVDKGVWHISDEQRTWALPATEEWRGTQATLRLVTYHENDMEERSYTWEIPDRDRELGITLTTFRDRLTPGEPETWTLHIAAHDGTPAQASLLSALYDAALDVYGKNVWTLAPWQTYHMTNQVGIPKRRIASDGYEPNSDYQTAGSAVYPTLKESFFEFPLIAYGRPRKGRLLMRAQGIEDNMVVDEAVYCVTMANKAAADDVLELKGSIAGLSADDEDDTATPTDIYIREDLRHTAFFMPSLHTDKNGDVEISFTAPDLLTEWHFQNVAFTEDLRVGSLTQSVITRKELMVQPNVPRFLRQGDRTAFTAKVSNVSDHDMDVLVRLTLADARTKAPLSTFGKEQTQAVHLAAGEVKAVRFPVTMPKEVFACTYTITAQGDTHSDGEQGVLPVLTTRTLVTESLAMYANPGEKKSYTLTSLEANTSPTLTPHKLTLEYTSTPIWYAIQALPALEEVSDPSNLQLFHRYFAHSLSLGLLKRYPQIEEVFRRWAEETPDAFLSNLEKDNDLKQIVLSETPWLLQAQDETADRRRIADFFDTERAETALASLRGQLIERQNSDGGWSWMPDYQSSTYITLALLRGFGELQQEGCIDLAADTEIATVIQKALRYVDAEYYKEYVEWKKLEAKNKSYWEKQRFTPICTHYLLVRSAWKDMPFEGKTRDAFDYFYAALRRVSHVQDGLMTKALTALTFERNGDHALAKALITQLQETALVSDEMGMYWRDNQAGWCWYNAPIETQAMLIEAFYACDPESPCIPLLQQWLLKQKQTTRWDTDVATAHAIYALLTGDGSAQLAAEAPKAVLTAGGKKVQPAKEEAGTGYFRHDWQPEEIRPALGKITIDNSRNRSCSWGALYWQYFEEMDKVTHSEQGFAVSAQWYKVTDEGSLAVIDGPLQVGDKVKVRLRFTVDRNLEYVQVKALRPACFEPVSTRSGRHWNGGLSYYLAVEDASASLYIDYLAKGDYTVEMDYFVTHPGEYVSGTVTLQCLYAPAFRATFSQPKIVVIDNDNVNDNDKPAFSNF